VWTTSNSIQNWNNMKNIPRTREEKNLVLVFSSYRLSTNTWVYIYLCSNKNTYHISTTRMITKSKYSYGVQENEK